MGNSMHEQLLKSGLASKKQLKKAKQAQQKTAKQQQPKGKRQPPRPDALSQEVMQADREKAARDRALNLQRRERAKRKEIDAQVTQLIVENRLKRDEGTVAYHFAFQKKVGRVYVSEDTRQRLSRGRMAIIQHRDRYEVIPAEIADKIRQRDEQRVIVQKEVKATQAEEEDPYKDFPVPDDIDW